MATPPIEPGLFFSLGRGHDGKRIREKRWEVAALMATATNATVLVIVVIHAPDIVQPHVEGNGHASPFASVRRDAVGQPCRPQEELASHGSYSYCIVAGRSPVASFHRGNGRRRSVVGGAAVHVPVHVALEKAAQIAGRRWIWAHRAGASWVKGIGRAWEHLRSEGRRGNEVRRSSEVNQVRREY